MEYKVRAAKVEIDTNGLERALGFPFPWKIHYAQINYNQWGRSTLQLIVIGDTLPECFEVKEGEEVKKGQIIIHSEKVDSKIVPT